MSCDRAARQFGIRGCAVWHSRMRRLASADAPDGRLAFADAPVQKGLRRCFITMSRAHMVLLHGFTHLRLGRVEAEEEHVEQRTDVAVSHALDMVLTGTLAAGAQLHQTQHTTKPTKTMKRTSPNP